MRKLVMLMMLMMMLMLMLIVVVVMVQIVLMMSLLSIALIDKSVQIVQSAIGRVFVAKSVRHFVRVLLVCSQMTRSLVGRVRLCQVGIFHNRVVI